MNYSAHAHDFRDDEGRQLRAYRMHCEDCGKYAQTVQVAGLPMSEDEIAWVGKVWNPHHAEQMRAFVETYRPPAGA